MKSFKEEVREIVAYKLGFELVDVKDDSNFYHDLGLDDVDEVELMMEFEKVYNISISDDCFYKIDAFSQLVEYLQGLIDKI